MLVASALLASCTRRAPTQDAAPLPVAAALAIDVSQCATVTSDGACLVGSDGAMRALVGSSADARFTSAEGAVDARGVASFDDARLYELHVAPGVRRVRVAVAGAEGHVDVRRETMPAWLAEADAKSSNGDDDAALAIDAEHRRAKDDAEAALAASQAARIELGRGRIDASAALFREAIARERAAGRASDAVDDSLALAFSLGERAHRLVEARAALDAIRDLVDRYPDGRAREPYYRAVIDTETGRRREAFALFRESEKRATRLGLARLVRTVRGAVASELDLLGRNEEALAIRRELDFETGPDADPCDRLLARSGMGFGLLLMAMRPHAEHTRLLDAIAALDEARGERACKDDYLHAVTLGNAALAALLDGRVDDAAKALAAARALAADPPPSEGFFWLDLEGRVALARRAWTAALRSYDEMDARARAAVLPEHEWSALVGRGAALEGLGRAREAITAYARAEDTLDDAGLAIPVGEGRARFLVERERSATAAIALLVARGDRAEALRWARRARRRVLAGLEAARRFEGRDPAERARWDAQVEDYVRERARIDDEAALDWKLPVSDLARTRAHRREREAALRRALEALLSAAGDRDAGATDAPPSEPGTLTLLLHPARDGWTAFAADATGVTTFAVPPLDPRANPAAIARAILAPARAAIDRASRVRLLLPGELASIDVHALPYPPDADADDAAPLVARVPVEYAADLASAPPPDVAPARALVVGDPQRSLPEAQREARAVAQSLRDRGAIDVALLEANGATHAAVVGALGAASLFHYAGHALYGGEDGWDGALPLAEGGRLLVTDVLALRRAPARVIVSGCSAGRTAREAPGEGLGVAQAFLVAGSDAVIAPTRDVSDALSARFVAHLYEALRADATMDLARATRDAQTALRAEDPNADWASFRALRR